MDQEKKSPRSGGIRLNTSGLSGEFGSLFKVYLKNRGM